MAATNHRSANLLSSRPLESAGGGGEAAQLYRGGARQHADWAATGSLRTQLGKGTLPAWAAETPVCTRGNGNCEYPQAQANLVCADKMTRLQTLLGGVPPAERAALMRGRAADAAGAGPGKY